MPEKLVDIVRREGVDHLAAYFAPGKYTGRWSETFEGGDRAGTWDRITLIPVYDRVVRCQFGGPDQVWLKLHDRLAENGGELRLALAEARKLAAVEDEVSVLRALDVVLWRRHVSAHKWDKDTACPAWGSVGLR